MEGIGPDRRFKMALVARRWLAADILEVRIERPAELTFLPGQYVRFRMDGYQRDYTVVSHPDADTIDLCVALVEGGRFSTSIRQARPGDEFELSGPHGHFIYQGPVHPAVFVATGTGVAPFMAFCRAGVTDALLLHGVSTVERLVYRDFLQSRMRAYVACLSRPDAACDGPAMFSGRVGRYLSDELPAGTYDFYLCGRRPMIREVTALIDVKFGDSRIFIENYD